MQDTHRGRRVKEQKVSAGADRSPKKKTKAKTRVTKGQATEKQQSNTKTEDEPENSEEQIRITG